jgi:hypothetical protein
LTVHDRGIAPLDLAAPGVAGIEDSRQSFLTMWNTVLSRATGANQTVTSSTMLDDHRGRQLTTTGALLLNLRKAAKLTPYGLLGAGLISSRNGAPSVQLVGNYRFPLPTPLVPPPLPTIVFDQTDTVTVRATTDNRFAWVVGGGFKYAATQRWGVRVDARDHISRDPQRVVLDASPSSAPAPPGASAIRILNLTPPLVFTIGTASPPSTLSGPPVAGFTTFEGTGIVNQVNLSAAIFWRF